MVPLIAVAAAVWVVLAQALPIVRVEPIRIAYHAPARCPNEPQFLGEVFARTGLARSAAEGEPAREFTVDIADRAGGSLSGSLEIHSADGPVSRREMTANRCDELVSALALMVALAVDPEGASPGSGSSTQNPPPATPEAGGAVATWSTPATPASTPPPAPAAMAAASAPPLMGPKAPPAPLPPTLAARPARDAPSAPPAASEAEVPEPRHGHWAIGAQALVLVGLLPTAAAGGGSATLDYDFAPNRVSSPRLRFALSAAAATQTFPAGVSADFFWAWAHAEGCPLQVRLARSLRLAPCLGLDAGALRSQGNGLRSPAGVVVRPWFAAEAAAELGWTFAGGWLAHAALAGVVPFQRYFVAYDVGATHNEKLFDPVGMEAELGLARWLP